MPNAKPWSRLALYYAPPPGALASFGAAWLGWDLAAGAEVPHPEIPRLPRPVSALTETPRKYGFHGTLKPPFRTETRLAEVEEAVAALAAAEPAFAAPPLRLSRLGGFLALTLAAECPPLARLAFRAVEALDGFRLPPPEAELARRRGAGLSPAQEGMLARWGYPYVGAEFRFHMTLTCALPPDEARATEAALAPALTPLLGAETPVRALTLCGEAEDGRFHLIRRFALAG